MHVVDRFIGVWEDLRSLRCLLALQYSRTVQKQRGTGGTAS
jgi:hypothetical protein